MALHLIKLCVGIDSIEELRAWIPEKLRRLAAAGEPPEHAHTTRMIPRRAGELVDGGSLYWVIKGQIQARQKILEIRPFRDASGIRRCRLVMDPEVVATSWQPRRAFQGWRYLEAKDAPPDLVGSGDHDMPVTLRRELVELGLL